MTGVGRLADELRHIGREAGLDGVGICDARPFSETRAVIEARKESGESAGMAFTFHKPARSTDPTATMPDAKALFVGARSYARQTPGSTEPRPAGRVARYSWIDHYTPLRQALGEVKARLRAEGWRAMVLADDNALVDRAAAVRAGIGWYGKNANVLLPGQGSWFVLGAVLTDAPIAPLIPVTPVADGCGSCRRCMVDCPTGALVEPGHLDARRCLAWLVQAPGVFPIEHREALGDRLYGCDECQERCPVNVKAARVATPPQAEDGARPSLSVMTLLTATDTELEDLVGRWYIPGRDLRYIRRNALVILGNTASPDDDEATSVLAGYLTGSDALLRAHAVWAAARLGRPDLLGGVVGGDPMVDEELARVGR